MGEIQQSIGARFRERRNELGRTQDEVARMCGVAVSTIQRLEVGSLNPTLETLLGAAKAVELPLQALLGPSPRVPPTPAEALEVLRAAIRDEPKAPVSITEVSMHALFKELVALDPKCAADVVRQVTTTVEAVKAVRGVTGEGSEKVRDHLRKPKD